MRRAHGGHARAELLKIFQLFFVFTLPIVLAPHLGIWTPVVACFTAIGFFGLDQV